MRPAREPRGLTTREVRQRLVNKFGRTSEVILMPEHLVLFEVTIDGRPRLDRYRGGVRASRQRIDAVAVGIWARTQHLVHGFEIKVSRSDLLAELRDPSKAEAGARACDRWWLALGDRRLLRSLDEVPDGWGVLAPRGNGLTVMREPAPMPGERAPGFTASLLQAAMVTPSYRRSLGWQAGYAKAHGENVRADRAFDRGYDAGRAAERADAAHAATMSAP